jgi:catechol 2,3-dioxygenase-like lactoylglutathione lyase family enzyme
MGIRTLRLILSPTPEWEAARAFYRDVLGLEETSGWEQPGDRGSFLAAGDGEIELMEQDVAALGIVPGAGAGWHLALEVDDLESAHARLRGTGSATGIRQHPWGSRDFVVRDPAGNLVLIFSSVPSREPA